MKKIMLLVLALTTAVYAAPPPSFLKEKVPTKIIDEGRPLSLGKKIALYPVNRVLDLVDLLTFQFGFGFGLHANVHATRFLQAGLGATTTSKLGFDGRDVGLCNDTKAEISALCLSAERYKRQNAFGTFKDYTKKERPWLYRDHRDYWGIGEEITFFIFNLGYELHVKEAPDFLLGIFGVDYRHDDFPKPKRGNTKLNLHPTDARKIKKVVICPSRVISDSMTRMATENTVGSYFYRYSSEGYLGRLGEWTARDDDKKVSDQYSRLLDAQGFDLYRDLLEDIERDVVVDLGWEVVDVDETLSFFDQYAVLKNHRGQKIMRLPDYRKIAKYYGADAVLDIRVWECGVWRQNWGDKGVLKMDVGAKLITFPENEVVFDVRVVSQKAPKAGQSLLSFAARDGERLVREVREGCDVITAQIKDLIVEEK